MGLGHGSVARVPTTQEVLGFILTLHKLGVVVHARNPSILEEEELEKTILSYKDFHDQPGIHKSLTFKKKKKNCRPKSAL